MQTSSDATIVHVVRCKLVLLVHSLCLFAMLCNGVCICSLWWLCILQC